MVRINCFIAHCFFSLVPVRFFPEMLNPKQGNRSCVHCNWLSRAVNIDRDLTLNFGNLLGECWPVLEIIVSQNCPHFWLVGRGARFLFIFNYNFFFTPWNIDPIFTFCYFCFVQCLKHCCKRNGFELHSVQAKCKYITHISLQR